MPTADEDASNQLEPAFPFEFLVRGVPISHQATPDSKNRWKVEIRQTYTPMLPGDGWATSDPVYVTICYFPDGTMGGDIDNIIKNILDAMIPSNGERGIFMDDRQVVRVIAQKFEQQFVLRTSSKYLLEAMNSEPPVVYIRVDNGATAPELAL